MTCDTDGWGGSETATETANIAPAWRADPAEVRVGWVAGGFPEGLKGVGGHVDSKPHPTGSLPCYGPSISTVLAFEWTISARAGVL